MTITYDKQVLIKRGNTSSVSTYVGPLGELVLDTDTNLVYVHDGVTVGGSAVSGEAAAGVSALESNVAILQSEVSALESAGLATEVYVNNAIGNIVIPPVDLTEYATESYVSTQISNLVDGAPALLDTLNEIAAAINDDANITVTLTNTISNANVAMKGYVDSQVSTLTANAAVQAGLIANLQVGAYSNANVASYLPTYSGNIKVNNITFNDLSEQRTAYTGQSWRTLLESSLLAKPEWLAYVPDGSKPTLGVNFGFDSGGMWFTGNANDQHAYPIRTNVGFYDTDAVEVITTFDFSHIGDDHGIAIFNSATTQPYWRFGTDPTRIAYQFSAATPQLYGRTTSDVAGAPVLTVGETYTIKLVYDPLATSDKVTVELYQGAGIAGTLLDTRTINEQLPAGAYLVGFDADQDNLSLKSYFTDLTIKTLTNAVFNDVEVINNLTVNTIDSDLIPSANVTYSLGSATHQWRDLWVSNNTIYINSIPLSMNEDNTLLVNNQPVVTYTNGSLSVGGNVVSGGGSGSALTNGTQTFSLIEAGDAVFSGDTGGVNRGLVWDYGAESGGQNSTVRQDVAGLSVRAWTEVGEGEEVYSAPVNIVTNEAENEKVWRFTGDGLLALPAGGSITEGIVTDNPTIELTPANSSVESQKLVIKGGGGYYSEANGISINLSNIVFQVGDTVNVYIGSETYVGQTLYWRIVADDGNIEGVTISDPGEGTVTLNESGFGDFSFVVDNDESVFVVIVSPTEDVYDPETIGVASLAINGDVVDHHLHLTTGALNETSIFLGTDEHNVRTTTDGKIQITTPNIANNIWEFDTEGNLTLPQGGDIVDSNGDSVLGGSGGLPTVTVPGESGTTYKGLQVSYGMVHSNGNSNELNVNKIVIHKPAVTTTTIHPTSSDDDFQVSGLGDSDVLAMFVVYGDTNGPKPLSTLQAFAEEVIDLVILDDGIEGDYNTVDEMKAAFYANYADLALAANGLYTNFRFYMPDVPTLNGGVTTVREGTGATFDIVNNGNGTYSANIVSGGTNYLAGHKIKILGTSLTGAENTNLYTSGIAYTTEQVFFGESEPGQWILSIDDTLTEINSLLAVGTTLTITLNSIDISTTILVDSGSNGDGGQSYVVDDLSGFGTSGTTPDSIRIALGTYAAGATPDNDVIITVDAVDAGVITSVSNSGTAAGTSTATATALSGTNHDVGSGFTVFEVYQYSNGLGVDNGGTNYVVGDVITLLGANLTNGTTPENNITITVTEVQGSGEVNQYNRTGTVPGVWRTNSIDDGGADQYDTGNFISTNLAQEINYNGGETVANGAAAFGTGSTYSFVYDTAIFGLFATGSSATLIRTSGNSGADGNSTTEAGNIYGPDTAGFTATNAVTHINLVGTPYAGPLITFTRTDYGDEVDEISEGLHITKDNQGWLYNALEDEEHDDNTPTGSLWNNDGWDDFNNVESRTYATLESIWGGNFSNIPGAKMIMLDETTGKYWAIEFLSWTNNNQGGGASYTRQELDLDSLEVGIRFADGTRQTTAYVDTNVKLTAPGERRIEEVYGYKQVSVTAKGTVNLTTIASRNSDGIARIWVNSTTTTIDEILNDTTAAGIIDNTTIEFSLDNTTWYTWSSGTWSDGDERGYGVTLGGDTLTYSLGDTVYFRYEGGGAPVVWWNKSELPGGGSNFRGAVIDYHAFTDESTIIGTIHIVDDDGEDHITHTEVQSGSTDGENDDLWLVTDEGQIKYRRIDGESKTLKIQWSARVFYGSETND